MNVVAALIRFDGKVLIAQRLGGELDGLWEFPGGKVENGETEHKAIEREIKEELNIDVEAGKKLSSVAIRYSNKIITLTLYECKYIKGNMILNSHKRVALVFDSELKNIDMPLLDKEIVNHILSEASLSLKQH